MGAFAKLVSARASGGPRNYFRDGEYLVRVEAMDQFVSSQNTSVEGTSCTSRILTSTSTDPAMAVGKQADWVTLSDKAPYAGNVKQLLIALWGPPGVADENAFNELTPTEGAVIMALVLKSAQLGVGDVMHMNAQTGPQKKDKTKMMTYTRWTYVPTEELAKCLSPEDAAVATKARNARNAMLTAVLQDPVALRKTIGEIETNPVEVAAMMAAAGFAGK